MKQQRITVSTRAGIIIRYDAGEALFAFSPYTGLVYAVPEDHADDIISWLEGEGECPDTYAGSLGVGWYMPTDSAVYGLHRLLPEMAKWRTAPVADRPIVINWLLTGNCPSACRYCYAEDLMRGRVAEPTACDIERIAARILSYSPLAVVLTGGEPLTSPYLVEAINALAGKTGIMVDTSGLPLTDEHIRIFQQYSVTVRISLDSERPKVNENQRPLRGRVQGLSATQSAVDAICRCLDAGLAVTVQSVATKKTANDLPALGDKLFRLGVTSWRVLKVAPSSTNLTQYRLLVGALTDKGTPVKGKLAHGPYDFVFDRLLQCATTRWKGKMAVQLSHNTSANEVVLVAPNGEFYTESTTSHEKILIDQKNPREPEPELLRRFVDIRAHTTRYLGVIPPTVAIR